MLYRIDATSQREPGRDGLKGPRCLIQGVKHCKYCTLVR